MSFKQLLKISPRVLKALQENRPVVSLESTIISHGMPYPDNRKCAIQVEQILRSRGVEAATIAIMHESEEIEELARDGSKARKVSRRDIPFVLSQKGLGSTTVAGTMICSALAGIDLFVTGGLGGVHRGYEETMDVSADLRELGRTPVAVVSAGVKNILDIPRTLEFLQTEGVPIVTYGSKYFPAFFSPSSGVQSPMSSQNLGQIAQMLLMRKKLQLQNGVLVAVPNQDTRDGQKIQKAIQQALKEAAKQKIVGAATTPFLLKRVHTLTEGASIRANISLVKHNAQIGAQLAKQYNHRLHPHRPTFFSNISEYIPNQGEKLFVIGGCAIDYEVSVQGSFQLHQSCKGNWRTSFGGVGRNISEVASRLGTETVLITALGKDAQSEEIRQNIKSYGIRLDEVVSAEYKAPTFLGILDDNKDSIISISNMEVNRLIDLNAVRQTFQTEKYINKNDIVVVDANVSAQNNNLSEILKYLNELGYFIIYQCKGKKTANLVKDKNYQYVSMVKMNQLEKDLFFQTLRKEGNKLQNQWWLAQNIGSKATNKKTGGICAIITKGENGFALVRKDGIEHFQVEKSTNIKKTAGAGDTFTGTLCSMLLKGEQIGSAIHYATIASKMTVESEGKQSAICDDLTYESLIQTSTTSRSQYTV